MEQRKEPERGRCPRHGCFLLPVYSDGKLMPGLSCLRCLEKPRTRAKVKEANWEPTVTPARTVSGDSSKLALFCPRHRTLLQIVGVRTFCPTCGFFEAAGTFRVAEQPIGRDKWDFAGKAVHVLPSTRDHSCPECGRMDASFQLMQTRKADEAETLILTCRKCGHRWRRY